MAVGIQVWDASGNLIMDTPTRMGRVLGITASGTSGGSVTNSGFSTGTPFAVYVPTGGFTGVFGNLVPTFSGTTMSWGVSDAGNIVYGVY